MTFGVIKKKNQGFTAFRYKITAVTPSARRFYVAGDQTKDFFTTLDVRVSGSTENNGTYRVMRSEYEPTQNRTRITVLQHFNSSLVDGVIDILGKTISWETGTTVVVSSTKFLPSPLRANTVYYVIKLSDTRFKLAKTYNDALEGIALEYNSGGDGFLTVSELESSFRVMGGSGNSTELWYHYAIDKNDVRTFVAPETITGMQSFVNFIDGYAAYQADNGLLQGLADSHDFDPFSGRLINWQLEAERFIDWSYGLRNSRLTVSDSYAVVASPSTNSFTFVGVSTPFWLSGTAVSLSTTGVMPSPLLTGTAYYVVLTGTPGQIRLSTSPDVSDTSSWVEVTTAGSGVLMIGLYDKQRAFPRFELNPSRNNIWIDTPLGVLSNVVDGPYSDIRIQQTIYDQYNRPIGADKLTVYRQDLRSKITIRPEIANDIDPIYSNDPYNYIHFGGGHFFVEGYEHFLLLNNYTVGGALLFDPFFGLQTDKFNVDYLEKKDYTLRPTLGGYYLIDNKFERNLEGSATDMQNFYDIIALSETTNFAQHARSLVGYKGKSTFLDLLNINSKSQFIFHRGMIQDKGSVNSVNAYINSRRFVDAKLDEFWAWKLDTFGDARPRIYPELNLFMTDGSEDLRLEFVGPTESTTGSDEVVAEYLDSQLKNFNIITFSDQVRWNNFPEQKEKIGSSLFLDGEATSMTTLYASDTAPALGLEQQVNLWYNTSTSGLFAFDAHSSTWTIDKSSRVLSQGPYLFFQLDTPCDDVCVIKRTLTNGDFYNYTTRVMPEASSGVSNYTRINSELIRFTKTDVEGVITLFTINPAADRISPVKLIDNRANTVVQTIPVWHPAIGLHDPHAINGIDIQSDSDPANYSLTLNYSSDNLPLNAWNETEVGRIWWDTSRVGYMPYYDDKVISGVSDRVATWGQLAPWASNSVYKWVLSTVSPEKWDATVIAQATDSSIASADKATGTPRKTMFKRVRTRYPFTSSFNLVYVNDDVFQEGDVVVFSSTGSLPTGITQGTPYSVKNISENGLSFSVADFDTGEVVTIEDAGGTDPMYVVKQFQITDWKKQSFLRDRILAPFCVKLSNDISVYTDLVTYPYSMLPLDKPKLAWTPANPEAWSTFPEADDADTVDVYVNGVLVESALTVKHSNFVFYVELSKSLSLDSCDVIDFVRPVHQITSAESSFDPDLSDDGTQTVQWKEFIEYTSNTLTTGGKNTPMVTRTYYFFWVEGVTTRDETVANSLSPLQIAEQLTEVGSSYMIVQKPKLDPTLSSKLGTVDYITDNYNTVPVMYRQAILRKVMDYINDNDRYMLRFTRDLTLRNDIERYSRHMNIKDVHEKWVLFRRSQTSTIDRRLWDSLTQAMVGYTYDNLGNKVRVPSLDRELYDASYGTSTRIGLGVGQAFVDKSLGLSTVLTYLNDPSIDFSPANIDEFFALHSFDTPENIQSAMDTIYNTFASQHVNELWFNALHDSLSLRSKYEELMKTSWLALHGVRVLEVGGLFDD